MVRIIATDLDGTLLKPIRKFSLVDKENKNYIKNFYGDIVLVSGRNPKFCAKVCNCLNIHHNFIALNGAVIVKNGNVIYRQSMKKTALYALLEYIETYYTNFEMLIFDKYDRITSYSPLKKWKLKYKHFRNALKVGRLHSKIKINNKKAKKLLINNIDVLKVIIYSESCEDLYNILKKEFKNHFELFPNSHSIEISPKGVNKGNALQYLINTTKVSNDEVYVVGDSTNDISMFNIFKNSFVMDSADSFTKTKATNIISKISDLDAYTRLNHNFLKEK